jgi:hypothetical protein
LQPHRARLDGELEQRRDQAHDADTIGRATTHRPHRGDEVQLGDVGTCLEVETHRLSGATPQGLCRLG